MTERQEPLIKSEAGKRLEPSASLADRAYGAIRDAILSGAIQPDTKLNQLQLAEDLNVSQRTIREALTRLVGQGLAISVPYKGFWSAVLSVEEIREIYAMRVMLEGHAIEKAAGLISPEELSEMRSLLPKTCSLEGITASETQEANHRFHWTAIRASRMQQLPRVLDQLWGLSLAYVLRETISSEQRRRAASDDMAEHQELL